MNRGQYAAARVRKQRPLSTAARVDFQRSIAVVAGAIFLATVVWAVYSRAVNGPFIFDDRSSVVHNSSIKSLWPLWDSSGGASPLNAPAETPLHGRPVVNLSFAVNYYFGQLNPRGYRVASIAMHLVSAFLLWGITSRTLRLDRFAGKFDGVAELLGFASALVWALHPLDTESVVYVTQRTELMMGLCYLATLYASLRYFTAAGRRARATWLALAVVMSFLGMLSKEVMVSAPVMVLLFDRTFLAGSFSSAARKSWPLYLGLALTWLPLVALNLHGPRTPLAGFHLNVPAHEWWFTQAHVLFLYLKLVVWPWPLVIHYELPLVDSVGEAWPWIVGAALFAAVSLWLLWRRSPVGFVGTWVLAVLSPTLVVPIPTEVAAERRMYLALAAIVPMVVVAGYELARGAVEAIARRKRREPHGQAPLVATAVVVLAIALAYGLTSARRLAAYESELALWQDAELHQPDSASVHINLGVALDGAGRREEAIEHFRKAVELKPDFYLTYYNLARALAEIGDSQEAQAQYEEMLRLKPDFAAGHYSLALLLENAGKLEQAREHYTESLRLYPDFPMAHYNLARLLSSAGETQDARNHYERALRLYPDYASAHYDLGRLLAQTGETNKAIEHLARAAQLSQRPDVFVTLAATHAQAQRPAEAIATALRAAALARARGQAAEAARAEAWLKSYRNSLVAPAKKE